MRRLDRKEQDLEHHETYDVHVKRDGKKTKMNALHIKKARRLASPIKNAFGLHRVIGKRVCTSGLYLYKNS